MAATWLGGGNAILSGNMLATGSFKKTDLMSSKTSQGPIQMQSLEDQRFHPQADYEMHSQYTDFLFKRVLSDKRGVNSRSATMNEVVTDMGENIISSKGGPSSAIMSPNNTLYQK